MAHYNYIHLTTGGAGKMSSIVIYFSRAGENWVDGGIRHTDVGNTERAAQIIHDLTGADLFKIEPVVPYPENYDECTAVAKRDQQTNARPEIKSYPKNLDKYDTVYLGYPNYWGTMPMAVFTLLDGCDLSGKVVKPFCTHEGSGLGHSMSDVRKMCPGADVRDGLAIVGSAAGDSVEPIRKWLNK